MADLAFVILILAFFTVCVAFVRGCDRIVRRGDDEPSPDVTEVQP